MDYLLERLKEPSTWRGLTLLASALGAKFNPEIEGAIISTGLLVAGIIGAASRG